jgi:hypothetical protein
MKFIAACPNRVWSDAGEVVSASATPRATHPGEHLT